MERNTKSYWELLLIFVLMIAFLMSGTFVSCNSTNQVNTVYLEESLPDISEPGFDGTIAPSVKYRPTVDNTNGIFVDPVTGTNNATAGTMENPLASLQWATDRALAQGKVVFAAGGAGRTYASTWVKTNIYCGYNPADWTLDHINYPSTINADKRFGLAIGDGRTVTVDGCVINGGGSGNNYTAGVISKGAVTLTNNEIDGGTGDSITYGVLARSASGCVLDALNNLITGGTPTSGNATGVVNHRCDVTLVNNTIISDGGSVYSIGVNSWSAALSTVLVNNIIDGGATAAENWAVGVDSPSTVELYNNDITASVDGDDTLVVHHDTGVFTRTDAISLVNGCGWSGCDGATDNISADPKLDVTYALAASSPCIGGGIEPTAYYPGEATSTDHEMTPRPFGFNWDIGRDESVYGPMASIPAGCFNMGDALGDGYSDELPVHNVCLSAFNMDIHEVTNAEYKACVDAGSCTAPSSLNSYTRAPYYGNATYDNYPVIYVDWNRATAYCTWAGKRLPTEAEWEYAARGGLSGNRFPWGDTIGCSDANYYSSSSYAYDRDKLDNFCVGDTSQVGNYATNGYGLYDMAGNVFEWVNDWYDSTYYTGRPDPDNDPIGANSGASRVIRGGYWVSFPYGVRVSDRYYTSPTNTNDAIGFRCAASSGD